MKKTLLIIYLAFAILSLVSELVLNFRETKKSISTLNFSRNYIVEKLYYKGDGNAWIGNSSQGFNAVVGCLKNNPKERTLTLTEKTEERYRKYEGNDMYYEVWYNPKLDTIQLKTSNTGSVYYNGFLLMIFWTFIPVAIYSLIKDKQS